ncbi:1-aminocyclopropane-1-carboxylate oxidase homolog 3-like [Nicotiana sylvestris]|uniref:1-aminocyclopropane-1-carboxylate oxidase homolog 3-like n=1 Tax=Nicotiana sylvestris TaxID=4096 RepID=UPI00388C41F2
MLRGARRFHEQEIDVKKSYYSRDVARKVMYNYNFNLFHEKALAANWKDSLYSVMAPNSAKQEELPETCREIIIDYSDHVMKLGCNLLELLSEGLVLKPDHLKEMDCAEGLGILCNYYPACPQPELAIGAITGYEDIKEYFGVNMEQRRPIGDLEHPEAEYAYPAATASSSSSSSSLSSTPMAVAASSSPPPFFSSIELVSVAAAASSSSSAASSSSVDTSVHRQTTTPRCGLVV